MKLNRRVPSKHFLKTLLKFKFFINFLSSLFKFKINCYLFYSVIKLCASTSIRVYRAEK